MTRYIIMLARGVMDLLLWLVFSMMARIPI